jgi:hypothetical protein
MKIDFVCHICGTHACGIQTARPRKYCGDCRTSPTVYVYRFICPDGRSYVGSNTSYSSKIRAFEGLSRSNRRIKAISEIHPPNTWRFELLENLPLNCPYQEVLEAEQRQIDRLGTLDPERGFNMYRSTTP